MKRNFKDFNFQQGDFNELKQMQNKYRDKQIWLLDKLMGFNYFNKHETGKREPESGRHHNSAGLTEQIDYIRSKDDVYTSRELKKQRVKLSKIVDFQSYSQMENINFRILKNKQLPGNLIHKLNAAQMEKIRSRPNIIGQRSYSRKKKQFDMLKDGLKELLRKVQNKKEFGPESLKEKELALLLRAS